jgi:hypothetical protein
VAGDHRSGKGLPALPGEQDRPCGRASAAPAPFGKHVVRGATGKREALRSVVELALTTGLAETQPCRPSGFEALFGYNDAASR